MIEIVRRHPRATGRSRAWHYAPVVAYQHPVSGRHEELPAESFSNRRYEIGESVDLAFSARRGTVMRVPERPWLEFSVLFLLGLGLIGLQIASWVR